MVRLSLLQTHEPKKLREFIKEANKGIRAKISEEIKEERMKFSAGMRAKRKLEKEKRIIQIPKGSKKDDLIKIIMDNKKHFKEIIKDKKIKIIKDKKEPVKKEPVKKEPVAKLGESGIGKKRKREEKPIKKKVVDVAVKEESKEGKIIKEFFKEKGKAKAKPKAKPKIPTITITEEEKPKKKVIKVGGRFITPKPKAEPKSTLPPIPKPKAKIRLPKEEKPKGKAKAKDTEKLEELSTFKKKSGDKATTDAFIDAIEKRLKEDAAKMDELKAARAKETERLIKALEAQQALEKQQAETTDEEPDEIPYKDFKLIEGVPKNIKRIFYNYVDDRTGYASPENQREEIEELQRIEKNYIQAEANRKNKSLSAKKQLKAVQTIGSILIEVRNDINENPDIKKLYKVFTPVILKRVLDQKKKDEADLKKEQEEIKKQQKKDEKELKKAEAKEKPVEQPKDNFPIGKFPFKIKVDDKNIILKKNTPTQNKEDEKILRNRTDNMKKRIILKVGMTLMKLMKITDPKKIREEENNIVADPSILTTNQENRIVRQFSLMKYKNLQDKEEVYKFPRTAVPDTLALL